MKIFFKKPVRIILFIFWLPVGVFLTLYKVGRDFINYDVINIKIESIDSLNRDLTIY